MSVRDIIMGLGRRMGTPEQRGVWFDAAAKLRADPATEVVVSDPPPPAPPPNMVNIPPWVAQVQAARRAAEAQQAEAQATDETNPPEAA
jgi:hypothetical protein